MQLPEDSPVPAYLRRLLLSADSVGKKLFAEWYEAGRRAIDSLAAAGLLADSADPRFGRPSFWSTISRSCCCATTSGRCWASIRSARTAWRETI
jgi:hypothetical protein